MNAVFSISDVLCCQIDSNYIFVLGLLICLVLWSLTDMN